MHSPTLLSNLKSLSTQDKLQLVQELWDDIAAESTQVRLTTSQRQLLDERLEDMAQNPDDDDSWEDARDRILRSL